MSRLPVSVKDEGERAKKASGGGKLARVNGGPS